MPTLNLQSHMLDFEVTREKKYRPLISNGSFKERVNKKSIQVWYSKTQHEPSPDPTEDHMPKPTIPFLPDTLCNRLYTP